MPLKPLTAVLDLPFASPDGRVITKPGYDRDSAMYLALDRHWTPTVPMRPSKDQLRAALVDMLAPWSGYRFTSPDDAAGLVAAVLSALCRPVLRTCPAVLFDAAQQGSGKTKAALALGALVEGRIPGIATLPSGDEEVRKMLLSYGVDHARSLCIDNLIGHVKSASLTGMLTSGRLSGRVLGSTKTVDIAAHFLLTLTGNNASVDADLLRRTVWVRINAGDRPTHRSFEFDPVETALQLRRRIAVAACTLWRGYFEAGAPTVVGCDAGGFSDWNKLCRQPVLWLAREGLADGLPWELGDPAASMLSDASATDPDLETLGDLLEALEECSGGHPFSAIEAQQWARVGCNRGSDRSPEGRVHSALLDLTGQRDLSSRSLGRALMNRRDRVVGGRCLRAGTKRGGCLLWAVVRS